MKINLKHDLPPANATECAKKILENLKQEHAGRISDVKQNWTGNDCDFSLRINNLSVSGIIKVTNNEIIIEGKLPLLAKAFSGVIKNTIENNAIKLINDCK